MNLTDESVLPLQVIVDEPTTDIFQIEYLVDDNVIGTNATPPYGLDVANVHCGIHTVIARELLVSGDSLDSAPVSIQVTPANDLFANRTVLTGTNILFQSSLILATEEPGEPVPPYGYGYTGRSVWWSWTAPAKGSVVLTATNASLRIGVFTGDVLTNLVGVPQLYPGDGENSYSLFETLPGQTYQIMFDSDIQSDPVIGSLIFTPSPSNDDFANRITLSGYSLTITTPIVGASLEPGEPPHTYWWFGSRSVWYEWTPPASGSVAITQLSTSPMPVIDAYVGDSFTNLTQIQTGWNPQSFSVQKGVKYYLALGEYGDFAELPSVNLQLQPTNFPSALPPLQITSDGSSASLTWPTVPYDVAIESATNLTFPQQWEEVTAAVSTNGDQNSICVPLVAGSEFFRLRIK